jgi:uroporphyrinogen-III synthase
MNSVQKRSGSAVATKLPLLHKTVLVTRPTEQADELSRSIAELGARVVSFPTIVIAPPTSWKECNEALKQLGTYDALAFTSTNAVKSFFGHAKEYLEGSAHRNLVNKVTYAIGSRTGEAIAREGVTPTLFPDIPDSRELAEALLALPLRGKRLLFLKGDLAAPAFVEQLRSGGIVVDEVTVYRTCAPSDDETEPIRNLFTTHAIDVVTFFSPSSITNFLRIIPLDALSTSTIAVIGSTTAAAARDAGLTVEIVPDEPTSQKLVDAIILYYQGAKRS